MLITTLSHKELAPTCQKLIKWTPFTDSSLGSEERFLKFVHCADNLVRLLSKLSTTIDLSGNSSNYLLYMSSNMFMPGDLKHQDPFSYFQNYYGTNYAITHDTTLSSAKKKWYQEFIQLNMGIVFHANSPIMQQQQLVMLQQQQQQNNENDTSKEEDMDKDDEEEDEQLYYMITSYVQEMKKWMQHQPTIFVRSML